METRIQKTLTQWFPAAFDQIKKPGASTDYSTLNQLARYTLKLMAEDDEQKREPFKIIHLLYSKSTLYERNAIENEFLLKLACEENPLSLKKNLEMMPEQLRSIYLKTILEN
ncbi:MAG TPA: hypothetical protein PLU49_00785 [Saprospiraceae bacterium]|nr:hypothetical protein [Saprospirales bacterium]HRQ28577.1 hypothetical protein [Saprospiraceae bacterium]